MLSRYVVSICEIVTRESFPNTPGLFAGAVFKNMGGAGIWFHKLLAYY